VKPEVDLVAFDAYKLGVSRQHAQIVTRHNRVSVQDLGSSNGTFLNNGRLEKGGYYRLRHGDRLKLGRLELQVLFVVVPNIEESDKDGEIAASEEQKPVGKVPVIGSGQRIMVIEDDKHVAQTVQDVLTKIGFTVTLVDNVTDALFKLAESLPHAIVTELLMPDKSALDLIRYVRSRDDGKTLPFIVVSNTSSGYRMTQAVEAGVNLFLKKPFGIDELAQGINQILPQMRR
jgi:CheY-like chemotaxis protein